MEGGYFRIGRFGGAPVRIHWSAPIGAFAFCGFGFFPGAWAAFLLLILIHELGHAIMVRSFGLHVVSVDVHGLGGVCQHVGTASPIGRSLIAWGGVFGQAVILAIAFPLLHLVLAPITNPYLAQAFNTFIGTNLWLMAINLVPVPGFDGAEAWKLFGKEGLPAWWRRRSQRRGRVEPKGVVRPMPARKRFISNDISEDILEKTPTSTKRPPPHMLN